MSAQWRSEEKQRSGRDYHSSRDYKHERSYSPPNRRIEPSGGRRDERDDYSNRSARKREHSTDSRGRPPPPRRQSPSPARDFRPSQRPRNRHDESGYRSREPSPTRFVKRRRTRSPSVASRSDWNGPRRRDSRSRSRDKFDRRDNRPNNKRLSSPVRGSPTRSYRGDRGPAPPDIDSYVPGKRGLSPPRYRQKRSPSPRPRSITPPPRRRSLTPLRNRGGRATSPYSRESSPPGRRGPHRGYTPEPETRRRHPRTRTPSPAGDYDDRRSMDGPYPARNNHGSSNYVSRGGRGRGHHRGGSYRGSPVNGTPYSSHHGSPHSERSYRTGNQNDFPKFAEPRGDNPHLNSTSSKDQGFRQNNFTHTQKSQEELFQNHQQQSTYSHYSQSFRGRGRGRGGPYQPDRRFSGPSEGGDYNPPPSRGRGFTLHSNATWTASSVKRGGGPPGRAFAAPNGTRTSPAPTQHGGGREAASLQNQNEALGQSHNVSPQQSLEKREESKAQSTQSGSPPAKGFSISLNKKTPAPVSARPPSDLDTMLKPPPTRPANDRPPPTQPKGKLQHDKRQSLPPQHERRDEPPPSGPRLTGQHQSSDRRHTLSPRRRSTSPPPLKKQKQDTQTYPAIVVSTPKAKPVLPPEYAQSDSIYYRAPGNNAVIGAGTYGKVFKAVHIYTRVPVALKRIRMEGERDGFPITAVREIKLLQTLKSREHVIELMEIMVEKNECFMVFEYMAHDLTGLINHPAFTLKEAHKKDLGRQLFAGLEFLHRRGVMHRDIKAANLLVSNTGRLKYADFGLARFYSKGRNLDYTNRVITIWYRPPELLLGETQYGPAVDVWSAACVFLEMFTKKAIFPGEGGELSQLEKVYSILGVPTAEDWKGLVDLPWYELMHPVCSTSTPTSTTTSPTDKAPTTSSSRTRVFEQQYSPFLSPEALKLVQAIFAWDPSERPTAEQVLEHPYFISESPAPRQPLELADVEGEWHEYESKAHRREHDRKEREKRKEEHIKEREKRKARESNNSNAADGVGSTAGTSAEKKPRREKPKQIHEQSKSGSAQGYNQTHGQGDESARDASVEEAVQDTNNNNNSSNNEDDPGEEMEISDGDPPLNDRADTQTDDGSARMSMS